MNVYTCYFSNKKMLELPNCVYMSIAVGNPKYRLPYEIVDCKILKPYGIFGGNLSDEEYIRRYEEKLDRIGPRKIVDEIKRLAAGRENCVLLCHEKNPDECHRRDFAKWLYAKTGIIIQEYGYEPPKKKPVVREEEKDVEQLTIFDIM